MVDNGDWFDRTSSRLEASDNVVLAYVGAVFRHAGAAIGGTGLSVLGVVATNVFELAVPQIVWLVVFLAAITYAQFAAWRDARGPTSAGVTILPIGGHGWISRPHDPGSIEAKWGVGGRDLRMVFRVRVVNNGPTAEFSAAVQWLTPADPPASEQPCPAVWLDHPGSDRLIRRGQSADLIVASGLQYRWEGGERRYWLVRQQDPASFYGYYRHSAVGPDLKVFVWQADVDTPTTQSLRLVEPPMPDAQGSADDRPQPELVLV